MPDAFPPTSRPQSARSHAEDEISFSPILLWPSSKLNSGSSVIIGHAMLVPFASAPSPLAKPYFPSIERMNDVKYLISVFAYVAKCIVCDWLFRNVWQCEGAASDWQLICEIVLTRDKMEMLIVKNSRVHCVKYFTNILALRMASGR